MELTLNVKLKIEDDEGKAGVEQLTADAVNAVRGALRHCECEGFTHSVVETASITIETVELSQSNSVDSPKTVSSTPTTLKAPTLDDLLDAIKQIESGGDPNAIGDGGKAYGAYQIHRGYFQDALAQLETEDGDRAIMANWINAVCDDATARRLIRAYWRRYAPTYYGDVLNPVSSNSVNEALQVLARIHNGGGPHGSHSAATLPYWEKVKAVLQQRGFNV